MKKHIIYFFVGLSLFGCKKIESDLENNPNNQPIYKMRGSIDNSDFDFTVNNTNVFMESGKETMNGIPTYYTKFINTEDQRELKVSVIAQERVYLPLEQYSLADNQLSFMVHHASHYKFGYDNPPPNPPIISYSLNDDQFVSKDSILLPEYGSHRVSIRFKGLSDETHHYTIDHGFTREEFSPKFVLSNIVNGIKFTPVISEYSHAWFLNGKNISNDTEGIFNVPTGIHSFVHVMTDNFGNKSEQSHLFYAYAGEVKWILMASSASPSTNINNFGKVMISYKEKEKTYYSVYNSENLSESFKIQNLRYFLDKESSNGISFKFDVEFNGTLSNIEDQSDKKQLNGVSGTCKYIIE